MPIGTYMRRSLVVGAGLAGLLLGGAGVAIAAALIADAALRLRPFARTPR
jgi:hypothetical protein